jgi:ribosome biogenesis GTPase
MINLISGNTKMDLINLGWNSKFEQKFEQYKTNGFVPARIIAEHKSLYQALDSKGELTAELSGKYRFQAAGKIDYPTVGDWVAIARHDHDKGIIHALIPRRSAFIRKEAGQRTAEQVVATNIDIVFIVSGLDNNHNINRIERYLTMTYESGAAPIILLNKCDLCDYLDTVIGEVESRAIGVPVIALSAATGEGFDRLVTHLQTGKTAAFLGSSGVGKSSIINRLLGENRLKVNSVREDDSRGHHTTTHRELIVLPNGGIVIDTPGMRELQVWGDESGLAAAFDDIEDIARNCRFRDCNHHDEPGCAVKAAICNGSLKEERFQSYLKLKKELRYLEAKQVMKASAIEKMRWKRISQIQKTFKDKTH